MPSHGLSQAKYRARHRHNQLPCFQSQRCEISAILDDLHASWLTISVTLSRAESAGRMVSVLPALLLWVCGDLGVGSGAWVPA